MSKMHVTRVFVQSYVVDTDDYDSEAVALSMESNPDPDYAYDLLADALQDANPPEFMSKVHVIE